ncbi:MAG: hypothetical protein K8S27_10000 [Candidatus Omnitrophica bacterium]|nr:hypothetical protein [Candidatus Omnitrophota bacterium]
MSLNYYKSDEDNTHQKLRLKPFIIFWLLLVTLPFIYDLVVIGPELIYDTLKTCQAVYVVFIFFCIFGFLLRKDWGRRQIRSIFFVHLIFILYSIFYISQIPYVYGLKTLSFFEEMETDKIKQIVVTVSIIAVAFPFYIVFYLSHPNVRRYFQEKPKKKEEGEDEEEEN